MQKVQLKFTDGSNNEAGFKVGSSTYSALPNGFNIYSFTYKGDTFTREDTNVGSAYGEKHGARFWNGEYVQGIREKIIYFSIYGIVPDGNHTGTWIYETAYIHSGNNQVQGTSTSLDVRNTFSDLWEGYTDFAITDLVIDDPLAVSLGSLTNDGTEWIPVNLRHQSTNSISRVETAEDFQVLANTHRGLHIHNIITTNPAGDADPAEYPSHAIHDRGDVILFIGDKNVQGTAPESDLANYTFIGGQSEQLLWDYYDSTTTTPEWRAPTAINGAWGAELSMLDYLQKRKYRQTSVWKMGIDGATLSSFGKNTNEGQLFTNDLVNHVQDLWNEMVQPRFRAIILNVGTEDDPATIIDDYKELVARFRSLFEAYQAPVLLTVTDGGTNGYLIEAEQRYAPEVINDLYTIDSNDLPKEADGVTFTPDTQWDMGIRYAKLLKVLLDGELDVLAYDPCTWINFSEGYAPSGSFNSFTDLSDNANAITAIQGSGTMTTLNGIQAMRLTTSTTFSFNNLNPFGTIGQRHGEFEIFFAIEVHSHGQGNIFVAGGNQPQLGRFLMHAPWSDGVSYFDAGNVSTYRVHSHPLKLEIGNKYVMSVSSSVTEGQMTMRINGQEVSINPTATDVLLSNFVINGVGSNYSMGQDITLGEMIMFSNNIGVDNRIKIEGYLCHKWDIPLHNTHPYVDQPPTA